MYTTRKIYIEIVVAFFDTHATRMRLSFTRYLIFCSSWADEGCKVIKTNKTHTECECNHLTNFAVLMDVHAVPLDGPHKIVLQVTTYTGCIISIVCFVLTILTFHFFRVLKVR